MKPAFLTGQELPLGQLGPDEFAQFVAVVLQALGPLHGFSRVMKTSGPTDDGFDAQAWRLDDERVVAIQCKRMIASLDTAHVGVELAKVALQAALEGSDIAEHWFVTAGKIGKRLASAIRETNRETLIGCALDSLKQANYLEGKLRDMRERGLDAAARISVYVRAVKIVPWSGEQFKAECTRVWSQIQESVGRFFRVETVIRDAPQPNLDEERHLDALLALREEHWIELRCSSPSSLPAGLRRKSAADPRRPAASPIVSSPNGNGRADELLESLTRVPAGQFLLLVGEGGSGKTTTLTMAAALAAHRRQADAREPLPFLIALQDYRGDLDRLIHESASITKGKWSSLDGPIIVFADGLNEVPGGFQAMLAAELRSIIKTGRALVLSVRPGGLRNPLVLPGPGRATELMRLSYRQALKIVSQRLPPERGAMFLGQFRERRRSRRFSLAGLPFGLAEAIEYFEQHGVLPEDDISFIEAVLRARYERDREFAPEWQSLELMRSLAGSVAYELRIQRQEATFLRAEAEEAVRSAVQIARTNGVLGAEELTPAAGLKLLRDHEILVLSPDESRYRYKHDLVADYFASLTLASRWRDGLPQLRRRSISADALVFAATRVDKPERTEFLRHVSEIDLSLAAECSVAMGLEMEAEVLRMVDEEEARPGIFPRARAAAAAGTLHCSESSAWLHSRLKDRDWREVLEDEDVYPYVVALARKGDVSLLRYIQRDLEPIVSGPVEFSGGIRWLWDVAPGPTRLGLARDWLADRLEASAVVLSIRTIAEQGDGTDFSILEQVMTRSTDLRAIFEAFWALRHLGASEKSAQLLRAVTPDSARGKALIVRELARAGETVAVGAVITELLEPLPEDQAESPIPAYEIRQALVDALKACTLDAAAVAQLVAGYQQHPAQHESLWDLATHHQLDAFESLGESAADTGEPYEVGRACDFARSRPAGSIGRSRMAHRILDRLRADPAITHDPWVLRRVLSFLADEVPTDIAPRVVEILRDLLRCFEDRQAGRSTTLIWQMRDMLAPSGNPPYALRIDDLLRMFYLPASQLGALVPNDCKLRLLGTTRGWIMDSEMEELRSILRGCGESEIDEQLEQMADTRSQAAAIEIVAPMGKTAKRMQLVLSHLPDAVIDVARSARLAPVVAAYWCDELAAALVEAIAKVKYTHQTLDRMIDVAIERSAQDLVDRVIRPYMGRARTDYGNRMIEIWVESVSERRQ